MCVCMFKPVCCSVVVCVFKPVYCVCVCVCACVRACVRACARAPVFRSMCTRALNFLSAGSCVCAQRPVTGENETGDDGHVDCVDLPILPHEDWNADEPPSLHAVIG